MTDRPGGEPTEAPTEKRQRKAREEGRVAYSAKVGAALQLAVFGLLLSGSLGIMAATLRRAARVMWSGNLGPEAALRYSFDALLSAFLPLGAGLFAALLVAGFVQAGFRFTLHPLAPKLSRISMVQGFKRIFSAARLVDLLMGILAFAITGVLLVTHLKAHLGEVMRLGLTGTAGALGGLWSLLWGFLLKMGLVFALVAAVDWFLVWRRHRRSLMMTRYEVRKEMEQEEGNPHQKAERQRVHLELSRMGLSASVAQASAVLVNPTRLAVTLVRAGKTLHIGIVGEGARAADIRLCARRLGVPVLPMRSAARTLAPLGAGSPVPEELVGPLEVLLLSLERYGG